MDTKGGSSNVNIGKLSTKKRRRGGVKTIYPTLSKFVGGKKSKQFMKCPFSALDQNINLQHTWSISRLNPIKHMGTWHSFVIL